MAFPQTTATKHMHARTSLAECRRGRDPRGVAFPQATATKRMHARTSLVECQRERGVGEREREAWEREVRDARTHLSGGVPGAHKVQGRHVAAVAGEQAVEVPDRSRVAAHRRSRGGRGGGGAVVSHCRSSGRRPCCRCRRRWGRYLIQNLRIWYGARHMIPSDPRKRRLA